MVKGHMKASCVETFDASRRWSLDREHSHLKEKKEVLKPLMPVGVDHKYRHSSIQQPQSVETFDASRRWSLSLCQLLSEFILCVETFDASRRWSQINPYLDSPNQLVLKPLMPVGVDHPLAAMVLESFSKVCWNLWCQ